MAETRIEKLLIELAELALKAVKSQQAIDNLTRKFEGLVKTVDQLQKGNQVLGEFETRLNNIRGSIGVFSTVENIDSSSLQRLNELMTNIGHEVNKSVQGFQQLNRAVGGQQGFGQGAAAGGPALQQAQQAQQAQQPPAQYPGNPQTLGNFLGGAGRYIDSTRALNNLNNSLQSYGYRLQDITSIERDRVSGITRVTAAVTDNDERTESLTLTMDRLGNINTSVGGSFKTLADEVSRSIAQFAKFMVSATLVYGILNVISEQTQVVIDNQTELANIAIVLGTEQDTLNKVYQASAEAANIASESINGVLEAYQQAIRVTGDVSDSEERMRKANLFLSESLVLSKLSTLDQAKAMDILVAGLKQSNIEIENARDLLDRWVATSKVANVDMRTLAESYAIVATVAKSAGIEIGESNNELVGLIGVLAEQTQLTPTETGNALRAVITGLNTDFAIEQLRNFGIAVTDVNGEMRDFFDIATDINLAWQEGLISDSQLSRISRAIGGGVRRQGQVEIILKGLDRAFEINEQSANQYGSAEEALAIQTDTLSDAITRLGNAFQELAQSIGVEGGFLSIATVLVETLTKIVGVVETLSDKLGASSLGLLLTGGISTLARGRGRIPFEGLATGIDDLYTRPGGFSLRRSVRSGVSGFGNWLGTSPGFDPAWRRQSPGQIGSSAALGIAGTLGSAITNFSRGQNQAGGANIVGGLIGTAIGAYLGSPAAGALIGSSIAEGFVRQLTTLEGDINQAFRDVFDQAREGSDYGQAFSPDEEPGRVTEEEVLAALGGGSVLLGGIRLWAEKAGATITSELLALTGNEPSDRTADILERSTGGTEARQAVELLRKIDPEAYSLLGVREVDKGYDPLTGIPISPYTQRGQSITQAEEGAIERLANEMEKALTQQVVSGEISNRQSSARKLQIGGFESLISQVLPGLETAQDGLYQIGDELYTTSEALEIFASIIVKARTDELDAINTFAAEVKDASVNLDDLSMDATEAELENLTSTVEDASVALQEYTGVVLQAIKAREYEVPGLVDIPGEFTQQGLQEFIRLLPEQQRAFEEAQYTDLPARQLYQEGLGKITLRNENEYMDLAQLTGLTQGFDQAIVSRLLQQLSQQGGMFAGGNQQNPSFLQLPFASTSPLRDQLINQDYYQMLALLEESVGWQEQVSNNVGVYSDKNFELIQRDNTIIQFLLSQIEENTSDVVDGIYNLPKDGTFFVPYAAYAFGAGNLGAGGGGLDMSGWGFIGDTMQDLSKEVEDSILAKPSRIIDSFRFPRIDGGRNDAREYTGTTGGGIESDRTEATSVGEVAPATGSFTPQAIEAWERFLSGDWVTPQRRDGGEGLAPTSQNLTQVEEFSSAVRDAIAGTQLSVPPVSVTVDMTASFETFLDGQAISVVVKRYLAEEMARKGTSSGASVKAFV